jgi:hypothetical protein
MKTKIKMTLVSLMIGAAAFAACAQDDGTNAPPQDGPGFGPSGHHHRPPPLPLIQALDVNRDGIVDSNEIANASAELLTLDKNGDGVLTTNEYLPPVPKDAPADAPKPPTPLIVKALDVNGDGIIDATEIANAPAELKTLDKNGDGQLTRDEYLGKRPHPPQHRDDDNGAGGPPPDGGNGGPDGQGGPPPQQ